MNKTRFLSLMLGLLLLSGSVCTYPATLRVAEIPGAKWHRTPDNYYGYASVIPAGMDPYEWLGSDLEWDMDYEKNAWDCSNMTAYMEWVLENAGVRASIQAGDGHAWLMVWREDKEAWWAYECVGLRWINPWVGGTYYHSELEWDSIYSLKRWHGQWYAQTFAQEWCWWTSTLNLFDPLEVVKEAP